MTTLAELGRYQCKWSISTDHRGTHHFCAEPVVEGKPYCACHWAIAHRPPEREYSERTIDFMAGTKHSRILAFAEDVHD